MHANPIEPELLIDMDCQLGENPLWHPLEQRLYWTDILRGVLHRYDPATCQVETCYHGLAVGGFTIQADGSLLLFMGQGRILRWQAGNLTTIIEKIPGEEKARFNDVIADPAGRVFCGTLPYDMGDRTGSLYRLDLDGSIHRVLEGISISNGMGFTPDRRAMYYTDSGKRCIYRFDYDEVTGGLSNQRVWLETPAGGGVPDGLTVDAEGCVWSARWDGSAIYRYSPDGVELARIPIPARKVTSAIFGGPDYRVLFITTALAGSVRIDEGRGAGSLFRLRPPVGGVPEFYSRVKF